MWKILSESVVGSSHRDVGLPCQDFAVASQVPTADGNWLVAVCADGAGSARNAEVGSRLSCQAVTEQLVAWIHKRADTESLSRDTVLGWLHHVRQCLSEQAASLHTQPRELACTLLGAVLRDEEAWFFQIGDGAIVVSVEDGYEAVFWPQTGEYANVTNFVTNDDFDTHLLFERRCASYREIALFTDGIQMLALDFAARRAHAPFFAPLFARLELEEDASILAEPLRLFLESALVEERTDDDKTLILAKRSNALSA